MIQSTKAMSIKLSLIIIFFVASTSGAAQLKWPDKKYMHVSEEQPIEEFLMEFCSNQGVLVSISSKVGGQTVSGMFDKTAEEVFQQIVSAFNLVWYYDGSILYICRSDEAVSRIIVLKNLSTQKLKKIIDDMKMSDNRFPIQYYPKEKIVYISGPQQYVTVVENTAKVLDEKEVKVKAQGLKGERRTLLLSSKAKVATASIRVRSGPGYHYTALDELAKDTTILVLGGQKEWLFIRSPDGGYGWVPENLTTLADFSVR